MIPKTTWELGLAILAVLYVSRLLQMLCYMAGV